MRTQGNLQNSTQLNFQITQCPHSVAPAKRSAAQDLLSLVGLQRFRSGVNWPPPAHSGHRRRGPGHCRCGTATRNAKAAQQPRRLGRLSTRPMAFQLCRGSWMLPPPSMSYTDVVCSSEPLPELDVVAVWVADLRPRVGLANPWPPDDVDALGRQIVGRPLHVVDFECHHAVSEMFSLRGRVERSAFI